jgi:hypothetical protein
LENLEIELAEIGNCVAASLADAIGVMEVYRAASPAVAAFHHWAVNPARTESREKVLISTHKLRFELDPEGARPFAIVIHRKPRAERGGELHAHLVLGNVDATGKALDDSWSKIRSERLAREIEYDSGERPVLGRHHATVWQMLQKKRPEVGAWLRAHHGDFPLKPHSAITPGARNRARASGFNIAGAKASVRRAWSEANSVTEFVGRIKEFGLEIEKGEKEANWVVIDSHGANFVGAANRLLKMRRRDFDVWFRQQQPLSIVCPDVAPRAANCDPDDLRLNFVLPLLEPHPADLKEEADPDLRVEKSNIHGVGQLTEPR